MHKINCRIHLLFTLLFLPVMVHAQIDRPGATMITVEEKVQRDLNHRVFYEIFIRSFCDSDNDGIGDLNGITSRLDYLAQLGITGLWLTPFHPSPSYHKYDVLDYRAVDSVYGTLDDFRNLVTEAHKRNILVLMDLVVNHTAYDHPWFQAALKNDPVYKSYYVWKSNDDEDDHNWHHPRNGNGNNNAERYYGFFSSVMPDLNYDNPAVRQAMIDIGKWWLKETAVDGFRLDAAQFIYEAADTAANNSWWKEFTDALKTEKPDVITIGEVWNKKEIVATYMQSLTGAFNFELSWDLLKMLQQEKNDQLIEKLLVTKSLYNDFSTSYADPVFLSNHDVNRIMSDLNNNTEKAKLAAAIYLTLPGTPFIYYGEELGMRGKKPDEWIREPFLWDKRHKDKGQTTWEKPKYSTAKNVEPLTLQQGKDGSLYKTYAKLIAVRNTYHALASQEMNAVTGAPEPMLVYERGTGENKILVLHNLSADAVQYNMPEQYAALHNVVYQSSGKITVLETGVSLPPYATLLLSVK